MHPPSTKGHDQPLLLSGLCRDGEPLTPDTLSSVVAALRAAGRRPGHEQVAAAVDKALHSLVVPGGGRDKLVEAVSTETGIHPLMATRALDDLAATFTRAALCALVERELSDRVRKPAATGVPRHQRRAIAADLTVTALSGNVPAVTVEGLVLPLLTGSPVLAKAARQGRAFAGRFVQALGDADPDLRRVVAAAWWPGGEETLDAIAYRAADCVIAYGSEAALTGIRRHVLAPARMIEHGPKIGFAVVNAEAAALPETAQAAAEDVAYFDQQGCVSPHTIYVLGDQVTARTFAAHLATALEQVERRLPRGRLSAAEHTAIQQLRGRAEFRGNAEVFAAADGTAWTVVLDDTCELGVSCLNRFVYVKPLPALALLPEAVAAVRPYLQTVGVAGPAAFFTDVAEVVQPLGVSRVCPLGRMQHPPLDQPHDGRPRLADLVRWSQVELPD